MTRTRGAKGKPKNPDKELAKVKALYQERGLAWPPAGPIGQVGDETTFALGDLAPIGDAPDGQRWSCGNCKMPLPGELAICPGCNCKLEWS